ncbi:hypothetical protein DIZ76_016982 [Coccidioides immitis]|nr:hypothetical protein DIZ76_016982 [Coccidioides immitis]
MGVIKVFLIPSAHSELMVCCLHDILISWRQHTISSECALGIRNLQREMARDDSDDDPTALWQAYMDEWNITGASAVPMDMVMRQREKFFSGLKFRGIEDLLEDGLGGKLKGMV